MRGSLPALVELSASPPSLSQTPVLCVSLGSCRIPSPVKWGQMLLPQGSCEDSVGLTSRSTHTVLFILAGGTRAGELQGPYYRRLFSICKLHEDRDHTCLLSLPGPRAVLDSSCFPVNIYRMNTTAMFFQVLIHSENTCGAPALCQPFGVRGRWDIQI